MKTYDIPVDNIIILDAETTNEGFKESPLACYRNNEMLINAYTRPEYIVSHLGIPVTFLDESGTTLLVGHNIQFDLKYLMRDLPGISWHKILIWDTATFEYLMSGHKWKYPSLEQSCYKHGIHYKKRIDLKEFLKENSMRDIPKEDLELYVKEDVEYTKKLFESQLDAVSEEQYKFILDHCTKEVSIASIELNGMVFDIDKAQSKLLANDAEIETLKEELFDYYFGVYPVHLSSERKHIEQHLNITSNRTVSAMLTGVPEEIEIGSRKADKRTLTFDAPVFYDDDEINDIWTEGLNKQGYFSVNEKTLKYISAKYKLGYVDKVLRYRELLKESNTYLGPLIQRALFDPQNRVFTNINMTSVGTGRTSSSDPNFQNMPKSVRSLFYSDTGDIVEVDFSQLELFSLAENSKDEILLEDLRSGTDIHYEIGKDIMGWRTPDDMEEETRRIVKGVVFGLCYGGGANKLALEGGIAVKTARDIIKAFYDRYPGVKDWHDLIIEEVRLNKYPAGFHPDGTQKYESILHAQTNGYSAERFWTFTEELAPAFIRDKYSFKPTLIKNYPVQGFAGGDIVLGFIKVVYYLLGGEQSKIRIVNTVHDSVVFSVPKRKQEELEEAVSTALEYIKRFYKLNLNLKVNFKSTGKYWS